MLRLSSRLDPIERANARRAWQYSGVREALADAENQPEDDGKWVTRVETQASGRAGAVAERLWIEAAIARNGRAAERRYIETDRIEERQNDGSTLTIERRRQPASIDRAAGERRGQSKEPGG